MLRRVPLLLGSVGLLPLLALSLLGGVGCASSAEPPVVAVVDPVDGSHGKTDGTHAVKRNTDTRDTSFSGFRLSQDRGHGGYPEKPGPEFDATCDASTEDRFCGTHGRVSIEYSNHPLHADAPCKLVSLTKTEEGSFAPETSSACVVGDEIVATQSCMMCRLPDAGWSVHARISEMTPEQAKDTFTRLALQGSVPDDAEGWQEAIDRGQAPRPTSPY